MDEKVCLNCEQAKTLENFYFWNGYYKSICKVCMKTAYDNRRSQRKVEGMCSCGKRASKGSITCSRCLKRIKLWAKENRDQKLITNTGRRKEDKALVLNHYGQRCSCLGCDIETFEFLTVDHIKGNGGEHRRVDKSVTGGGIYRWLLKNNFPEGFRILCMNCNWSRGIHGYCPHEVKYSNGGIISQEKEKH